MAAGAALVVVVALLVVVVVVPAVRGDGTSTAAPGTVGSHLTPLALHDPSGRAVTVPPDDDRPVVLTLGSSSCEPCKREIPAVEKVYRQVKDRVGFYAVDIGDEPATAAAFYRSHGATYPVVMDPLASSLNAVDTTGMPTTVLVSPSGVIKAVHLGAVTTASLRSLLHEDLGVSP